MTNWRDSILRDFVPNVSKLTLVADPDGLLTEERLALQLRERGFDLIEFNDSVEFRFAYESKYRSIWDQGEHTDLVVILRLQNGALESMPYDLLQSGRKLSFNLGELFPNLSYPVIEKIDRSLLDAIFEAQSKNAPERIGDNATKDFILRHVFRIAAELVTNEVELLRALLRLHYGQVRIPQVLADRLIDSLEGNAVLKSWPLDKIVADEQAFFSFLQERWPLFLRKFGKEDQVAEEFSEYQLNYSGPTLLPFDHQDIRVYVDNLFVEGKLAPVHVLDINADPKAWFRCGIVDSHKEDERVRSNRLFEIVEHAIPNSESRYSDWTAFAFKWAELSALVHCGKCEASRTRLLDVGSSINCIFETWLTAHYSSLINLPPTNPAMVHHVPRLLARHLEESASLRVAMIVVDGLALDQWVTVRQYLKEQDSSLVIREAATFAWIPTFTSVSRQAIFSGKPPLYFPSSIYTTSGESGLWRQFWEANGIPRMDVVYQKSLGEGESKGLLDTLILPGKTRVVGLVIDMVDKIMHGMQLGAAGMHNQIKQWCEGRFLSSMIGHLMDCGFDVWMTADHGNIESRGAGKPNEGAIAETRGQRARVYPTQELRSQVANSLSFAHSWEPIGLPPDFFPLLARDRAAFIAIGDSIVGHGGIAIEEVIVPLIRFERRTR